MDASDDEDYIFKPKAKSQIDEAWNPKARVGPLLPKTNRPAREGVRKTSVEKGLEAAAAKRAKQAVNRDYFKFVSLGLSFCYEKRFYHLTNLSIHIYLRLNRYNLLSKNI